MKTEFKEFSINPPRVMGEETTNNERKGEGSVSFDVIVEKEGRGG